MIVANHKFAALLYCLLAVSAITAQQPGSLQIENKDSAKDRKVQRERRFCRPRRKRNRPAKDIVTNAQRGQAGTSSAANLIGKSEKVKFLSGQVEVKVKGDQDPIIKLGLARNGSTVVEFPASDNFLAVHPGSSHVVAVDESPTLVSDHYLVFRAGRDFVPPPVSARTHANTQSGDSGVAAISVQMQSGMFVTLMFYPVASVEKMAHRCVIIYSRDEVVARRRDAGLTFNPDSKDAQPADSLIALKRVASATLSTNVATTARGRDAVNFSAEAKSALRSAIAMPSKFTGWSKPLHGLSISLSLPVETNSRHQLLTLAIKNSAARALRLVAGEPSLEIITFDARKQPVLIQSLTKIHVETTSSNGAIPAGATVYFAIIYDPPALSVNQRVRVSAVSAEAADDPAIAILPE
jgi:hypothetical protein